MAFTKSMSTLAIIETFASIFRRRRISASDDQNSKPSQTKKTLRIRTVKLPADVSTPGRSIATTASSPDERRSGSEEVNTSNPDHQSEGAERRMKLLDERISKLARFGPAYGKDTEDNILKFKDVAWKHIIQEESDGTGTKSSYMKVIKKIEEKVADCYDDTDFPEKLKKGDKFRKMMVKDGCFFLQLALYILGAGDHLGYPAQNPYFGKKIDPAYWIPTMFFVGNQIPYILITALMKKPFFQAVIKKGTWKRPEDGDLAKLALYLTVVEPHLEKNKPNNFPFIIRRQPLPEYSSCEEPSSNILQTLYNLILRSGSDRDDPIYHEMKEFVDLEANDEGKDMKIPSAGELHKLGVKLVKGKPGISNIRFQNWGYSAFLYVPPFTIDAHTEPLLTSLANHELFLNESDRELTAYLRFMRDLSRTYKDFKILERKGIVVVKCDGVKGTMVKMLDTIVSRHNSNYTLNFRQIRRKVNDYGGPPWRLISVCLGILAVVQTIFTVLAYVMPLA